LAENGGARFPESVLISGDRVEISRMETGMRERILGALREGPKTVPEIAEALGIEKREAMWWVMGCWRYGYLAPEEKATDEGYFRYSAVGRQADGKG